MIPGDGDGDGDEGILGTGRHSEGGTGSDGARDGRGSPANRAARLLRWYPKSWQTRYGDEFAELLIADIEERPRSAARTLDVARGGLLARLADAGLGGTPLPGTQAPASGPAAAADPRVGTSLGSLSCGFAVFVALGAALWSQLLIALQWSGPTVYSIAHPGSAAAPVRPVSSADTFATVTMSVTMIALLVLAVAAVAPVLVTVTARLARFREARENGLGRPVIVLAGSAAILFAGGRHFENGWVGTGGHHAIVPSGLAAFLWAVTLFVSSYWAHPATFATLPFAERAWMALTPLVLAAAMASGTVLVRRVGLPARLARFEGWLGIAACAVMTAFLAGCAAWVLIPGPPGAAKPDLFHVGVIDLGGIAVLALALAVAARAAFMAMRGLRLARG